MTQRRKAATRLMPFAQFFGLAPRAEKPDEDDSDDDRAQREGESDEDYARRMEEQDRNDENDNPEKDDDPDGDDLDDPDDPDDDDDADAEDPANEDDDGKDDKKTRKVKKAARAAERNRCAAILAHGIKIGRTMLACSFAFDTRMSASEAKSALSAADRDAQASKPHHRSLVDRMADVQPPNPGVNGGTASANPAKTLADRIVAVGESVRRR